MNEQKKKQIANVLAILQRDYDVTFSYSDNHSVTNCKATVFAKMDLDIDGIFCSWGGEGNSNEEAASQAVSNFIDFTSEFCNKILGTNKSDSFPVGGFKKGELVVIKGISRNFTLGDNE